MLKSLIFLTVFLHFSSLQAQDGSSINGQLIDSTTFIPVPFAHVRLRESVSISNQHGRFTLNYTETDLDAEVKISCVGYKTRTVTISFLRKFQKVFLVSDTIVLNEVIISELTPQAIFKKAEKKGYKNYQTSRYSADYTLDQYIFYEDNDSLIAISKDSGIIFNKGLDTTGVYPNFNSLTKEMSVEFLKYDTLSNQLTSLTKQRNTVSPDILYSYDPVRVGILKQFHPVPTIFSKGFYTNTEQQISSIVSIDNTEYYLIVVSPKIQDKEGITNFSLQEKNEIAKYKNKIRELAIQNGRNLSENTLDSIFSVRGRSKLPSFYVMGFFLVNTINFGISHAFIKVNTFDGSGKLYAKLHVAASYIESGKSYYLESLDVLMKRTEPNYYNREETLYYLLSLKLSNFKTRKVFKSPAVKTSIRISQEISGEIINQFKLENIKQFLMPIKYCITCNTKQVKYFNQIF